VQPHASYSHFQPYPLMSWSTNIDSNAITPIISTFSGDCIQFRGNSRATGPSSRKILILRRLHPVRGNSQATGLSSRKISWDWIQFEENFRRLDQVRGNYENSTNDSISKFISYLTYICSYFSFYVEVGRTWNLSFPTNTSTNNSSEQIRKQAAWDIVMREPAAKEANRNDVLFIQVFLHIFMLCRNRGDVEASFP
jgi:hypothetical protein